MDYMVTSQLVVTEHVNEDYGLILYYIYLYR
jgi:hypothetical protein